MIVVLALLVASPRLFLPEDVPPPWRPWGPLDLSAQPTVVSAWKVRSLASSEQRCLDALRSGGASVADLPDRPVADGCGVPGRVRLAGLARARVNPVETQCQIAARLYLWERHVLQPAARHHFGTTVREVLHFSSYSCRRIRTSSGIGSRMSQHSTANAIDISGFVLADGRRITLLRDWDGDGAKAAFLRDARDGLCEWFNMVLSPDYNRLHADHFHADMGFWRGCR